MTNATRAALTKSSSTNDVTMKNREGTKNASLLGWAASAAIIVAAGAPGAALAQPEQEDGVEGVGLDRIVVTAQRREEDQQDVPISLTVLPKENLANFLAGGDDILALATRVPGLYAESSNGRVAPRFYIRGLGNTDFDLAASQPVSVIQDEVVLENVILKSFPLFDIANIEVLRGPQGTLFGRNTPAGTIKFDTAKPTEEFEGFLSGSLGRFFSTRVEGGVGGPLIPGVLSYRISGLYTQRDNYIDNGFTNEEDALGGFEDVAGRLQVLYTPTERVSALFNVHARRIEGTSTLFRANVLGPGDNDLNENFDRDLVFFDGGGGNPQSYDQFGLSGRVTIDLGFADLISISAFENASGASRGDIDGGAFFPDGPFPGFIPFPSDTTDGLDDLNQFTQEVRLASNSDGPFRWQAGFFYFDSDFTISTFGDGFPPLTTVRHTNDSWGGLRSRQL